MKQNQTNQESKAKLLSPDFKQAIKRFASQGYVFDVEEIYLAKLWDNSKRTKEFIGICYCRDFFSCTTPLEKKSPGEPLNYQRAMMMLNAMNDNIACLNTNLWVEELDPGTEFEYNNVLYLVPQRPKCESPYVLSLLDALELFEKSGFEVAKDEIFIGDFGFVNAQSRCIPMPIGLRCNRIGVCYMIEAKINGILGVVYIRAFNEYVPRKVQFCPKYKSVIKRFSSQDSFKTVLGEQALINGVMTNYNTWLQQKLNSIHDSCHPSQFA